MADSRHTPEVARAFAIFRVQMIGVMGRAVVSGLTPSDVERLLICLSGTAMCFTAGAIKHNAGSEPFNPADTTDLLQWIDRAMEAVRAEITADMSNAASDSFPEVMGHG